MHVSSKACARRLFLAGTAAIAGIAAPQLAQAQAEPPLATTANSNDDASADSGAIIVTAQRREQSLQEVPLSVTAIPPERLEQLSIRTVEQLQAVTPGLVFNSGYSYSQTYIRGVGAAFPNPGLEAAVSTYVDGAYVSRGFNSLYEMVDVDTVQVLKGPQGTLYGRNATGGAILINSRAPTGSFEASATGEIGNLDHRLLDAMINLPVADTVSIRLAGRYRNDDGHVTNLFTGDRLGGSEAYIGRGSVKWDFTPDWSARLLFQYNDTKGTTPPARATLGMFTTRNDLEGPFAIYNGKPILTCLGCDTTSFPGTLSPVTGFYETDQNEPIFRDRKGAGGKSYFYNLMLDGDIGPVAIQSVTAFRNQDDFAISDLDFTRAELYNYAQFSGSETFTQDIVGNFEVSDRISGLAGFSYLDDTGYFDLEFSGLLPFVQPSASGENVAGINTVKTKSVAFFGELTVEPIDDLKLTVGGRYSKDKRRLTGDFNDTAVTNFGLPAGTFENAQSFDGFTPRFVISYDTGPANIYASYNKGFKAGGFNTPALVNPFGALIVKPEKIESYEAGIKFVSDDRKLRANLAAFYYEYTDVQVGAIRLELGGQVTVNGAAARGKGAEFDFSYQPTEWLTIFGAGAYLDAKFKDFPNAAGAGPTGDPNAPVFDSISEDAGGFSLARSPKFSGNIGATIAGPVGGGMKADLTGFVRYSDRYDYSPGAGGPLRTDFQPSHTIVDASGNIGPENGNYSIGFFVKNLTDRKYLNFRQSAGFFGAFDNVAPPRTYGARVQFNY